MTAQEELHAMVDRLTAEDAAEALDYLRWLQSPRKAQSQDELSLIERGEDEIAHGEYVTLADLIHSLHA